MLRRLVCAAATAVIVSTGFVTTTTTAGASAPADVVVPLPSFAHLLVDSTHGHVFITGGPGTSSVNVRSLTGAAVQTISGEPGADGLALSSDGATLYVALNGGDAIAAIDASTLTETARYSTGTGVCPTSLATLGATLWFGYACTTGGTTGIGAVDLSAPTISPVAGVVTTTSGSILATSPALPNRLFAGEAGGSSLRAFDASGTALTQTQYVQVGGNLSDVTVTPDGSDVLTASGGEYDIAQYRSSDLSRLGQYGQQYPYPVAVAVAPGGQIAAGMHAPYDPDIRIYTAAGNPIGTFDFDGANPGSSTLGNAGLAFDASASHLYAIATTDDAAHPVHLHVISRPTAAPTTISVSAPATSRRGSTLQISGEISSLGADIAGAQLTISRHDLSGAHALHAVTADPHGRFSTTDAPTVGGAVTYTVSYAGDDVHLATSHAAAVSVSRVVPSVTVQTNHRSYGYRGLVKVTAHLGSTYNGRTVSLYATPAGAARHLIKTVKVDKHGLATGSYRITTRTAFTASFGGDYRYAARSASTTATSGVKIVSAMAKSTKRAGRYHVYVTAKGAALAGQVLPDKAGECLHFILQKQTGSGWHLAARGCFTMNAKSIAVGIATGSPGTHFRNRVEYSGDKVNSGGVGKWYYIEFR